MIDGSELTHCPSCSTEHRAGYTICTVCGTLLVDGPSPVPDDAVEGSRRGSVAFGRLADVSDEVDRFALEETPIVLTSIVEEDAPEFLAALEGQGIGARAGDVTEDGGVEILIHAANLADAQAVLLEFTGDVELDHLGLDGDDDDLQVVTTARLGDAGRLAARLRDAGLDVRIDVPSPDAARPDASASILVRAEELARARELLGIVA